MCGKWELNSCYGDYASPDDGEICTNSRAKKRLHIAPFVAGKDNSLARMN